VRTNNRTDHVTLWFKPTGYRPADVALKYPVYKIEDVYHFNKYDTAVSPAFGAWCWVQLVMILLFISYLFGNIALINGLDKTYIFWYGGFVFLAVYALTDLMDGNRYALIWEVLKCGSGIGIIVYQHDWFGINSYYAAGSYLLIGYFAVSLIITGWFSFGRKIETRMTRVVADQR